MSLNNKGLKHYTSLEDLLLPANSCEFDIRSATRGGIRVRFTQTLYEVEVRNANGQVDYQPCLRQSYDEPFRPHFGLVASNKYIGWNDIDILGVYIKNMDPRVYQDAQALEEKRLQLLLEKHRKSDGSPSDEREASAHDLLSAKLLEEVTS